MVSEFRALKLVFFGGGFSGMLNCSTPPKKGPPTTVLETAECRMAPPDDVHHRLGALSAKSVTVTQQAAAKDLNRPTSRATHQATGGEFEAEKLDHIEKIIQYVSTISLNHMFKKSINQNIQKITSLKMIEAY